MKDRILVYIIVLAISFFIPDVYGFITVKFMYPFFVIGYLFHKKMIYRKLKPYTGRFAVISGLVYIFLLSLYSKEAYIYTSGHYILKGAPLRQLGIDLYRTLIGLVGSAFVMLLIKIFTEKIKSETINKGLSLIGRNTIGIYALSGYVFTYIVSKATSGVSHVSYLLNMFETIFVLGLCLAVTMIMKKSSIVNTLFFGSRKV